MSDDQVLDFISVEKVPAAQTQAPVDNEAVAERQQAESINFKLPERNKLLPIIKVVGVGGGGSNAVDHMFRKGIRGVAFVNCNTDEGSLDRSPVPMHLLLGKDGLGAGNIPDKGRQAAEQSLDAIRSMLSDGTRMVFIAACLGGGTGTGAAPVIAREAQALGILTIGIVTLPMRSESRAKMRNALRGLEQMESYVDAMIVINNQKLFDFYKDTPCVTAYGYADDMLYNAAGSIVDIIMSKGYYHAVDFHDVEEVLRKGQKAYISTAFAEGPARVTKAISQALNSPLLNYDEMYAAHKILISLTFSQKKAPLMTDEMNEVMDFLKGFEQTSNWVKYGLAMDDSLDQKVKVTILVSGFNEEDEASGEAEEHQPVDQLQQLYNKYYPPIPADKQYYIYTFTPESLDNNDVIAKVTSVPTYRRNAGVLNEIKGLERKAAQSSKTNK